MVSPRFHHPLSGSGEVPNRSQLDNLFGWTLYTMQATFRISTYMLPPEGYFVLAQCRIMTKRRLYAQRRLSTSPFPLRRADPLLLRKVRRHGGLGRFVAGETATCERSIPVGVRISSSGERPRAPSVWAPGTPGKQNRFTPILRPEQLASSRPSSTIPDP